MSVIQLTMLVVIIWINAMAFMFVKQELQDIKAEIKKLTEDGE
jgi:hypothetical protein